MIKIMNTSLNICISTHCLISMFQPNHAKTRTFLEKEGGVPYLEEVGVLYSFPRVGQSASPACWRIVSRKARALHFAVPGS